MWKLIPNTLGKYEASVLGDIRASRNPNKILRPKTKKNGYLEIVLCTEPKLCKSYYVHRLVAETFLGLEKGSKLEVNHKNRSKKDNKVTNLEIVTHANNLVHANMFGEGHPNSKITKEIVLDIRSLSRVEAYKKYPEISQGCIYSVHTGRSWKHVE